MIKDARQHCIVLYAEDEKRLKWLQAALVRRGVDKGTMNKSAAIRAAVKELVAILKEEEENE